MFQNHFESVSNQITEDFDTGPDGDNSAVFNILGVDSVDIATSAPDTSSDITMPTLLNHLAFHLQWHLKEKVEKGMMEEEAKKESGMLEHQCQLIPW